MLREVERYLKAVGARTLTLDQTLCTDILDIDLAGRYEPWRPAAYRVRIFNDVTSPRFKLRYTLQRGGQTVRADEQTLSDINYLDRAALTLPGDRLRYERPMLENWVRSVADVR